MLFRSVSVLRNVATDRSVPWHTRGDAEGALNFLVKFDFVFVLHLMEKIMKITDILCHKLQNKTLDIANALDCVSNTKVLLAELREDGWESLIKEVETFCLKHEIDIPDMNQKYVSFPMFSVLTFILIIHLRWVLIYVWLIYVAILGMSM